MNIAYPEFPLACKIRAHNLASSVLLFLLLSLSNLAHAIDAPTNVRGTEVSPGVIKWEWNAVNGAALYDVIINNQFQSQISDTVYHSHDLGIGEHSLVVKAISSNWDYSGISQKIKSRISGSNSPSNPPNPSPDSSSASPIQAPRDVRGTEVRPGLVKWEWAQADGASQYEVTIDGQNYGLTTELHFRLTMPIGEHFMSVKTIRADGQYSSSSRQARSYVEGTPQGSDIDLQPPAPVAVAAPPADPNDNGLVDPSSWSYSEVYQKDGYELVFSDEFNGNTLNRNRWNTQLRWDGDNNGVRYEYRVINRESQFYVNIFSEDQEHLDLVVPKFNPFEFDGSRLAIRSTRNPLKRWDSDKRHGPLKDIVSQQEFLSGVISSYDKFSQKYGYFEANIKIPNAVGTFPAFWLHHQRLRENTKKSEIDIMENLGHNTQTVYTKFHYYDGVVNGLGGNGHALNPEPNFYNNGTDWSQDYHVYAAEWSPGLIRFFIDGLMVGKLESDKVDHEELYIIANLAVGGDWNNYPTTAGGIGRDSGNLFPNQDDINNWPNPSLEIDYIRAYKRK